MILDCQGSSFDVDNDHRQEGMQQQTFLLEEIRKLHSRVEKLECEVKKANERAHEAGERARQAEERANGATESAQTSLAALEKLNGPASEYTSLSGDMYDLMKIRPLFSRSWALSTFILHLQIQTLRSIYNELDMSAIPYRVESYDTIIVQYIAVIISVAMSRDVVLSIKEISTLWISNKEEWEKLVRCHQEAAQASHCLSWWEKVACNRNHEVEPNSIMWFVVILLPNLVQLFVGTSVIIVTFWVVVQSEDVLGLLKDFTAIQLISELDDIGFWLAEIGYFGERLKNDTMEVRKIQIKEQDERKFLGLPLFPLIFLVLLGLSVGLLTIIVVNQANGYYFRQQYPLCEISTSDIRLFGNDQCDGVGDINSFKCGFEDGDCTAFNLAFPNCDAKEPFTVSDGICNDENNYKECAFDGGDCLVDCQIQDPYRLGDGNCDDVYNTEACGFDKGDCL